MFGLVLLAGCAQPMLTQVTVAGAAVPAGVDHAQVGAPGTDDTLSRRATTLVADALRASAQSPGENRNWVVQAAVGVRDPRIAIGLDDPARPHSLTWAPTLPVRGKLRRCDPRDVTLTVSVLDGRDGAIVRRASAARVVCATAVEAALPDLVDAALVTPETVRIEAPGES